VAGDDAQALRCLKRGNQLLRALAVAYEAVVARRDVRWIAIKSDRI
jgi:hypothetical protein